MFVISDEKEYAQNASYVKSFEERSKKGEYISGMEADQYPIIAHAVKEYDRNRKTEGELQLEKLGYKRIGKNNSHIKYLKKIPPRYPVLTSEPEIKINLTFDLKNRNMNHSATVGKSNPKPVETGVIILKVLNLRLRELGWVR